MTLVSRDDFSFKRLLQLHQNTVVSRDDFSFNRLPQFKVLKNKPNNLIPIFSEGGKQDHLIDYDNDRHAKIFDNQEELLDAGYIDASGDDLKALTPNKKVGLIFH